MKKKTGRIIAVAAGALTLLIVTGGIVLSCIIGKQVAEGLFYCNEGNDTKGNSIRQLEKWGYDLEGFSEEYGSQAISFTVAAEDGNAVPAELFRSGDSRDTVILVHGHGGDHAANYPIAEMYLKNGWNVITFDQRASGNSPDDKVSFGYYEKLDVQALVDYAGKDMDSERIVVHGQSMGAATAGLYAATEHAQENIEAVIMDSSIDSMENMFRGEWRDMEGTEGIPENYVVWCGDRYLRLKYGFGFADADVCEKMKENRVSTLMLCMKRDNITSVEKMEEMFENVVAKNKKICYFDSKHIEGLIDDPKEYEEAVFSFLDV